MNRKKYPEVETIIKINDSTKYKELNKTDKKCIETLNEKALNSVGFFKK